MAQYWQFRKRPEPTTFVRSLPPEAARPEGQIATYLPQPQPYAFRAQLSFVSHAVRVEDVLDPDNQPHGGGFYPFTLPRVPNPSFVRRALIDAEEPEHLIRRRAFAEVLQRPFRDRSFVQPGIPSVAEAEEGIKRQVVAKLQRGPYRERSFVVPPVTIADVIDPDNQPHGGTFYPLAIARPKDRTFVSRFTPPEVQAEALPEGRYRALADLLSRRPYRERSFIVPAVTIADVAENDRLQAPNWYRLKFRRTKDTSFVAHTIPPEIEVPPAGQQRIIHAQYPYRAHPWLQRPAIPEIETLPPGAQRIIAAKYPYKSHVWLVTPKTPEIETPAEGVQRIVLARYPYRAHTWIHVHEVAELPPEGQQRVVLARYPYRSHLWLQLPATPELEPPAEGDVRIIEVHYPYRSHIWLQRPPVPEIEPLPEGQQRIIEVHYPYRAHPRARGMATFLEAPPFIRSPYVLVLRPEDRVLILRPESRTLIIR